MAVPGKLSASKIMTYMGCSFAYFLKYVEHLKVPTNIRFVFGKAIHYMTERFYKVNYQSSESFGKFWNYYWFSSIAGDFLGGKAREDLDVTEYKVNSDFIVRIGNHVDLGHDNPLGVFFGYIKLGRKILERFYNRHKNKQKPFAIERSFGVKKDELLKINGHLLRGVFDRIDEVNGDWYLTDYKTDKSIPEPFLLNKNPQFTLYSYAFRKILQEHERALLYYHLRTGEVFKTYRSEGDFSYLQRLLDDVSGGIIKEKFIPFYGYHCNFCDYRAGCERYVIGCDKRPKPNLENELKILERFDWEIEVPDWIEMQAEER